jgi:putative sigma-54 modulation protein
MVSRAVAAKLSFEVDEMNVVEIRSQQLTTTNAMRDFVTRRAEAALARYGADVRSATLRLHDINGPRGGNDKQCLLAIAGTRVGTLVVKATDADFYTAVDRVMKRADQALRHLLGRKRRANRKPAHPAK